MTRTVLPPVSAAASWMESLHMPMREIQAKYTKSEIAVLGWRASEMAHNLREVPNPQAGPQNPLERLESSGIPYLDPTFQRQCDALEEKLGPIAYKIENKETGEIDLRKLTGPEALRFMGACGIPLSPGGGMARTVG